MSNPTSNFGWQMPTPTDLVTDLPADFEVFGQAVDTSLADLKGGTTGQVLAKNSNTDMDFVWSSPNPGDITAVTAGTGISGGGTSGDVTITNSMATAIDAKGDLIAGTGADSFSRIAAGANGEILVADSTTATGLDWKTASEQYPWQTFSPAYSNLTIGNGTVTARYQQIGKLINFTWHLTFGSTSAITGAVRIDFPVQVASVQACWDAGFTIQYNDDGIGPTLGANFQRNTSVTSFNPSVILTNGTYAVTTQLSSTVPFTWTTGDEIMIFGRYESA